MLSVVWFKRLFSREQAEAAPPATAPVPAPPAPAPAEPESDWTILSEDDELTMRDPQGRSHAVAISQMAAVAIEASEGESGIERWWLFYGPEEDVAFTLPFGARGEGAMVERVAALPGFRHDIYADAVRTADLDTFVVWSRPFD